MVLDISVVVWNCGECGRQWQTEEQAIDCAYEDIEPHSPTQSSIQKYQCEICSRLYDGEDGDDKAEECEQLHKKKEDDAYSRYLLKQAAQHPGQFNLSRWHT